MTVKQFAVYLVSCRNCNNIVSYIVFCYQLFMSDKLLTVNANIPVHD
jgi:hypothetical protein